MLSWRILPLPLAIALLLGMHASAQSLSGLRVGDDLSSTARLGLSPVERNRSGPFTITKWRLPDGNELSVTAGSNGKIVYIESDWVRSPSGTYSDFPGLYFGRTSLTDIRQKFGSNGFAYGGRTVMRAPDKSMVMFNSYEVAPENELVVTFITKVSPKDAQLVRRDPQSTGILAKLDSIILGNAEYLRNIWGSQLGFDPAYHKISWQ